MSRLFIFSVSEYKYTPTVVLCFARLLQDGRQMNRAQLGAVKVIHHCWSAGRLANVSVPLVVAACDYQSHGLPYETCNKRTSSLAMLA